MTPSKRKPSIDALNRAQAKYLLDIENRAMKLAHAFLRKCYSDMRNKAIRKNKHKFPLRQDLMNASHICVSNGGILPFSKEEIICSDAISFDDLRICVINAGHEPELMFKKWRNEAESYVKLPAILQYEPEDTATLDAFLNDEPQKFTKTTSKFSKASVKDLNFD